MKSVVTIITLAVLSLGLVACGDKGPSSSDVENVVKLRLLDEHLYKTLGEGGYRIEEHLSEVSLANFALEDCKQAETPDTFVCHAHYEATVGGEARPATDATLTLAKNGRKWAVTSFAG